MGVYTEEEARMTYYFLLLRDAAVLSTVFAGLFALAVLVEAMVTK